ncbi:prolipoprotein diacylglyceryl transferase [Bacteroidia bacterium]|nr:prolipoprotein diacylglyceryl transferase [Bacteroidia bacterium]
MLSITWNIDPEIFRIGAVAVRYYGLLFAIAFAMDYLVFTRFFKDAKLPIDLLDKLTMWAVVSTIIGLRLGHCFFYAPEYYLSHPIDIFKVWEGGLASHGAAAALPLGLYFFCRKYKMRYLWLLDRIVIVVALTGFPIRLGNLMNSEIYGVPTAMPWGFIFARNGEIIAKHPTQIYESLGYLLIFCVLFFIYKKRETLRNRSGFLFGLAMILIFGFRILVEFIKETQDGNVDTVVRNAIGLDMGQLLSVPLVLAGVFLLYYAFHHAPNDKPFVGNVRYKSPAKK